MSADNTSLVTCCTACAATFYVTAEQLGIHRGEVSCGRCGQVFNALERLSELADKADEAISDNVEPDVVESKQEFDPQSTEVEAASPVITIDLASKSKLDPGLRHKSSNWILPLSFLLVVLIIAQLTYHLRTQISSGWPAFRPALMEMCHLLNCEVALAKQADLLTIDDSDLQEDVYRPGLIHFSSTIINNADFVQAYPVLELTLTDSYDKPLLRRSFMPREYLPAGTDISQGLLAKEELRINLALSASGEAVAGYRVFVTFQ